LSVINSAELGALIFEISVFVITFSVSMILFYRYFKKRNNNLLIFAICILVFSFAAISQSLDILIFDQIPKYSETSLGYNFAFLMSAYANILLALFFLRIYEKENVNLIISIYSVSNIVNTTILVSTTFQKSAHILYPLLHILNTTLFENKELSFPEIELIRMMCLILHLALSMILYIYMTQAAVRSSRKDLTLKVRRGFQLIASFGLFLLIAFIFFIMDFISGALFRWWYSPWLYIGWTSATIGAIMAYLGYIMPDWLKRRWEE
jgi:hypothetical protein